MLYEILICRQWNNLFDIFYLNDHEFMKFSDLESIKILFERTECVCLLKHLNNTSQNNTMTQ